MPAKKPVRPGTLAYLAECGRAVVIICIKYRRYTKADLDKLAQVTGWAAKVEVVSKRLVCTCKHRGARSHLSGRLYTRAACGPLAWTATKKRRFASNLISAERMVERIRKSTAHQADVYSVGRILADRNRTSMAAFFGSFNGNVRVPDATFTAREKTRHEGNGALSYNAWTNDATEEKLLRHGVREASPPRYGGSQRTFYEFFAGGGMVRQGLGKGWSCLFANDFDPKKARTYRENWRSGNELLVEDINNVSTSNLPDAADLAWASFPCQDLSLAGKYAGIGHQQDEIQTRSGTFWSFWRLMMQLKSEGRAPKLVALENVYGVLTSNGGADFSAIGSVLADSGYRFGPLVIDARLFVPQSRPRVFIISVRSDLYIDPSLTADQPMPPWHVEAVKSAYTKMPPVARRNWIWWRLPEPTERLSSFSDLIENSPEGVQWNSPAETQRLLAMMNPLNLKKVQQAKMSGKMVGGVYRRTRTDDSGERRQRAEVRFDNIAGCLRTPSGGSSRQMILLVDNNTIRSRLLSPREAARLMGLPETYKLPSNYNEAYHLCGDGVVVPVVRHIAMHLLEPLVDAKGVQALLPIGLPLDPHARSLGPQNQLAT